MFSIQRDVEIVRVSLVEPPHHSRPRRPPQTCAARQATNISKGQEVRPRTQSHLWVKEERELTSNRRIRSCCISHGPTIKTVGSWWLVLRLRHQSTTPSPALVYREDDGRRSCLPETVRQCSHSSWRVPVRRRRTSCAGRLQERSRNMLCASSKF